MKIKRLIATACALMMIFSVCAVTASAANVTDEYYYKENLRPEEWGGTGARYKEDASKVYVRTDLSAGSIQKVSTLCYESGLIQNKTKAGTVYLANNLKYAITNFVYEQGDYTTGNGVRMWLGVSPSAYGNVSGWWSHDWIGTGTGIAIV